MRTALAIAVLGAAAATARADGVYLSDQLGLSTFHGGAARAAFGTRAADLRSALGLRVGPVALELWLGGDLPTDASVPYHEGLPGYGVDLKYYVPIARGHGRGRGVLAAYGVAELRSVWLGDPSQQLGGGRGVGAGVGLAWAGTLYAPTGYLSRHGVRFAFWIERSADWLRIAPGAPAATPLDTGASPTASSPSSPWDVRVDHWVAGFGFGGDV